MSPDSPHRRRRVVAAFAAALSVLCLVVAGTAPADTTAPALTLGPVSVANGTATIAGNVGSNPDGSVVAAVNGQPLNVDANGNFSASFDLAGRSSLDFTLKNPATGEVSTISIPLTSNIVGTSGTVPSTVLDQLRQAGITITVPPDGFASTNGLPLPITGSVGDKSTLATLTINGTDVLSLLKPDGTFSVPVPGTSKTVDVSATDKQGVNQSSAFPLQHLSSTMKTSSSSVAASSADGIVVTTIKYRIARVKTLKRITMTVTVKDKHGLLIQGAKIRVRAATFQNSLIRGGQQAKTTNSKGTTTFTLPLRAGKFVSKRRLFTVTTATTPSATTHRTTSVRIPQLTKPHKAAKK
jgi:hypothetical protein